MSVFLDTNVLMYSISTDPSEAAKRLTAIELLERADVILSAQVLQEFYVQATRATRRGALTHHKAAGLMVTWTRFPIQDTTLSMIQAALELRERHGFSYWDSAILAAARAQGCKVLYTEDMNHGQQVDGVLITNPFL